MPRYRHFRERLNHLSRFRASPESTETNKRTGRRWLIGIKLGLEASVPLMIAVFTVLSYVQQMQIGEYNREKDLEIANLTRVQDQMVAKLKRDHDLEISNLTQIKYWEIAMTNLDIANQTKVQDRQIAEENRRQDLAQQQNLHYKTFYYKYIEYVSTVIYK